MQDVLAPMGRGDFAAMRTRLEWHVRGSLTGPATIVRRITRTVAPPIVHRRRAAETCRTRPAARARR